MTRAPGFFLTLLTAMVVSLAPAALADDGKTAPARKQAAPKADVKPATKPAAKAETKPATKAETKPAAKAETKPAAKPAAKQAAKPEAKSVAASRPVSFLHEVAPVFVENCIGCHNAKKAESKYAMTTFTQLAKGGAQSEGVNLEPGKPEESYLVEVIRPNGNPRMPYKLDPLSPEKIKLIERWVAEGAKYDGTSPAEDWTIAMHKVEKIAIPETYPATIPVTGLTFTPDGQTLLAAGFHEITAWKTATGTLIGRYPGLAERIYRVVFSPDGKWLATASGDPGIYGVARLFKVEANGKLTPARDLAETQDVVFAVAFSPDSKRVAIGSADRSVRVLEVETGKPIFNVEDHADWVVDVAFSPDGKRLATASRDKTTKVFDIDKKESLVTFPGHNQPVFSVAFTPDGKGVASAGEDNRIRIWNPDADGKSIREIGGFGGAVFAMLFTPDGKNLLGAGADKSVRVFTDKGATVRRLEGHQDWIYALAVSRDGKMIASGSWDGEIRLWNAADGKLIRSWIAAPGYKPPGAQASR